MRDGAFFGTNVTTGNNITFDSCQIDTPIFTIGNSCDDCIVSNCNITSPTLNVLGPKAIITGNRCSGTTQARFADSTHTGNSIQTIIGNTFAVAVTLFPNAGVADANSPLFIGNRGVNPALARINAASTGNVANVVP